MEKSGQGIGRCKCAFWFAVVHDIFGLLTLMAGVFWPVFFHDFLIYAGAVIIFLSLIWWVFWYTGNIEVPPGELEDDIDLYKRNRGISGVVRKVSDRLSSGLRNSFRKNGRGVVSATNSRPNGFSSTQAAERPTVISMISCTNIQPQSTSDNFSRELLSI